MVDLRNIPDMDEECIELCEQMNRFEGIATVESCCGHGKESYNIYFTAESLKSLPALVYWFDSCHCGMGGWKVEVYTDCGKSPVKFSVAGPVGAYAEAETIAGLMKDHL